ncbi:MAG: hypothetical protein CMM60_05655 [Rhodospirillaceae bacterium]|nr:hypothetical protein [Rhodospirillaceae bacterium]
MGLSRGPPTLRRAPERWGSISNARCRALGIRRRPLPPRMEINKPGPGGGAEMARLHRFRLNT